MQIHKFAVLLLSFHEHVEELALAVVCYKTAEEDIRNGYTQSDADDSKRCLDGIVHTYRNLTYHTVHINESKECTIHQYTRYHRDYTWNRDTLVRSVEPVTGLDNTDTDEG